MQSYTQSSLSQTGMMGAMEVLVVAEAEDSEKAEVVEAKVAQEELNQTPSAKRLWMEEVMVAAS